MPRTLRAPIPGLRGPGSPLPTQRPERREEGSDVQARTQASLSQEERRQPRQAAQRLNEAPEREKPRSPLPRGRGFCMLGSGLGLLLALGAHALDADLRAVLLEGDGRQLHLDALPEARRGRVATAAPAHERLELLLDAELAQARRTVLEMLGDHRPTLVTGLVIQELEDVGQHVVAGVDLDRLAGTLSVVAHDWLASSPAPARTNPRSRA